jgi:hypothetical protein
VTDQVKNELEKYEYVKVVEKPLSSKQLVSAVDSLLSLKVDR